MERIVEKTEDGSNTLFIPQLGEHYHSTKGALTESQHVFVDMGMLAVPLTTINMLEIGFGTGLNAILTLQAAQRHAKTVNYTALELYPLDWETIGKLHYSDDPLFAQLHLAAWDKETHITDGFTINKLNVDFTTHSFGPDTSFDVVYFDAFAPEKQPEMWNQTLFDYLYRLMNKGGVMTTYCAKGSVRRMFQQAGFAVERLQGPPGGKREILRATKS